MYRKGLPCLPPAALLYEAKDGADIHVHPAPDDATTVSVGSTLKFIATIIVLSVTLVFTLWNNVQMRRKLEAQVETVMDSADEVDLVENEQEITTIDPIETENTLETPLLSQQDGASDDDNVVLETARKL